jgi:hypothetical protein
MSELHFQVDSVDTNGLVLGCNGSNDDIPLGTVFTSITKAKVVESTLHRESEELGEVAKIALVLAEVHFYRRLVEAVPGGHSAGLKLTGSGLEVLRDTLQSIGEHESVHLRARTATQHL